MVWLSDPSKEVRIAALITLAMNFVLSWIVTFIAVWLICAGTGLPMTGAIMFGVWLLVALCGGMSNIKLHIDV